MKKIFFSICLLGLQSANNAMDMGLRPCPPLAPIQSVQAFPGRSTLDYDNYQRNPLASCVPLDFNYFPIDQLCKLRLENCGNKPAANKELLTVRTEQSEYKIIRLYEELLGNVYDNIIDELAGLLGNNASQDKVGKLVGQFQTMAIAALETFGNVRLGKVARFVEANRDSMFLTNMHGKTGFELLLEHGCVDQVKFLFEDLVKKTVVAKESLNGNPVCPRDIAIHMYFLMLDIEIFGPTELNSKKYCAAHQRILQLAPYADTKVIIESNKHTLLYHAIKMEDVVGAALLLANDANLLHVRDAYTLQLPLEMSTTPAIKALLEIVASTPKKTH